MNDDDGCQVDERRHDGCRECGSSGVATLDSAADVTLTSIPCRHRRYGLLQVAFYDLPLVNLQLLSRVLRSADTTELPAAVAPISAPLAEWIDLTDGPSTRAWLATLVDVLLALYVIAEETAPPDQLTEVIENVANGRLDRLPLPGRGPCFCGSQKRYKKCHGVIAT